MTSCRHVELVDENKRLSLAHFVRPLAMFDFSLSLSLISRLVENFQQPTTILDPLSDLF